MTGNVWEWTRSAWGPWSLDDGNYAAKMRFGYPYVSGDGREASEADKHMARVLRGGSFFSNDKAGHCAFRNWDEPGNRNLSVGFRVVVSPSFSPR